MSTDERQLWRVERDGEEIECVMISCCSGAELQVRRQSTGDGSSGTTIVLRELYPAKSDLYERARSLRSEFERCSTS